METLKLEKSTAIKIFKDVPKWFQETLMSSFGTECFSGKIINRVKTYEDAWELADEQTRNECWIKPDDSADVVAYKKLKLIIAVINEGWKPDWKNGKQRKWWPWFNLSSGFRFDYSHYHYVHANATVGSRLCFETEEKSNYVAKQFIEIYEEFLTIKN